jgi:replicative DNA helicase
MSIWRLCINFMSLPSVRIVVWLLYNPDRNGSPQTGSVRDVIVIVAKNRNGDTGKAFAQA